MKLAAPILVAMLLSGCTGAQAEGPVIDFAQQGDTCLAQIGSRTLMLPADAQQVRDFATAVPKEEGAVRIVADDSSPYRCVGAVIYYLQVAGHRDIAVLPRGAVSRN